MERRYRAEAVTLREMIERYPTPSVLGQLHLLTTNGYHVAFDYNDDLHGVTIAVDKEIDGRRLSSFRIVPDQDWTFAGTVLAEMRRELEAHERDD